MADVASTLRAWSATAGSNAPSGSTVIGSGLDDNLRELQAVVRKYLASAASNMASASTVDLSTADGYYIQITGTTTITGFGTESAGVHYVLRFAGALTLTHNGTSLILPGGVDITTVAGDIAWMVSEGSGNWRCLHYSGAGTTTQPGVLELATTAEVQTGTDTARAVTPAGLQAGKLVSMGQVSASGPVVQFTPIPSWVRRITIQTDNVSPSTTARIYVQIGDSGGLESSGYASTTFGGFTGSAVSAESNTTGFFLNITGADVATNGYGGTMVLTLMDAASFKWVCNGSFQTGAGTASGYTVTGYKNLTATLDRVALVTSAGTFDAGSVNVLYE